VDLVEALKNGLPARLRHWLRDARRELPRKLLPLDRVTDFSSLRKLEPHRRGFGAHRGQSIDRYYIEKFLAANQAEIHGNILEVQSDDYTRRFGGSRVTHSEVIDLDIANPKRTITADLTNCPEIADDRFDSILCTQTLLLIYDVPAAIRELYRILKPGGVLLATLPGIAKVCERSFIGGAGEDYWRFTSASTQRLFSEAFGESNIGVTSYGNVLSAIAFLHGLVTPELTPEELDYNDPEYQMVVCVRARKEVTHA
jgi:SAM-dependent methyltransferase